VSLALEIAVASDAGARLALAHGADRVELSAALELDGITPSQGLVDAVLATGAEVHVLVRCRPGDFVYDDDELRLMRREARAVVAAGARGVVIGALTEDGSLDLAAIAALADAAREVRADVAVTVHRAIDASTDPVREAERLAASSIGPTRVLTSGGRPTALAGADVIAAMAAAAPDIEIMSGGGVDAAAVGTLAAVGVAAVHLSAKRPRRGTWAVDPSLVAAARAAVDEAVAGAEG
jgi:copper homeostasis protein